MKKIFSGFFLVMVVGVFLSTAFVQSHMTLAATDDGLVKQKMYEIKQLVPQIKKQVAELSSMYFKDGNLEYKTELLKYVDIVILDLKENNGRPTSKSILALEIIKSKMNGFVLNRTTDCDDTLVLEIIPLIASAVENASEGAEYLTLMGAHVYGTVFIQTNNGLVAVNGAKIEVYRGTQLLYTIQTPVSQTDIGHDPIPAYTGSYDCMVTGMGNFKLLASYTANGIVFKKTFSFTLDGNWTELNKDLILKQ